MKRTPIEKIPYDMPREIEILTRGAKIYDSSCSPEARVYFIDKENGYYLKRSPHKALENEAKMTSYFHSKGLGTEVILYVSDENDWLITKKAEGEDCTHEIFLSDPKRLCDTIAQELRKLHELDFSGCPIPDRNKSYFDLAAENHKNGAYDLSYYSDLFGNCTPDEAYAVLQEGKKHFKSDVLLHGDYCLPNIMLDNWKLSCFIDVGNAGVGDRHIDLYWGAWTLAFNLKTDKYRARFFDAYGKDKINEDMLKIVAAAEVFG
jgi:kanamycin kinase